ncbi:phage head closure protein [Aquibium sp. LZ166]|uniref:Phage head closure protein n=1 Tax=Aquibium pacificus TaxID=3153579 RepID=A0ABV3SRL8_9HYPH
MRAGKLDRIITIERKTETVADSGAVVVAWTNVASVRAELVNASLADHTANYGTAEEGSIVFRVRYLPGVAAPDRIVYSGISYDILSINEIGRRRSLEIRCGRVR